MTTKINKGKRRKTIEKINKCWFFEKITRINKSRSRLIRENMMTKITIIRNSRGDIITDSTDMKRTLRSSINNFMSMNLTIQ